MDFLSKEGIAATVTAVCIVLAFYLFLRDIRCKKAQPYIWAWVIRIGIVVIAFACQAAKGATFSLALSGTQLVGGLLLIAYMLVRQRRLGKLDAMDYGTMGLAGVGLLVWLGSGDAIYAAIGVIVADAAATIMGVRAAFIKGAADSLPFWLCCLAAGAMAVVSTGGQSLAIALIPLASFTNAVLNIGTILIVRARRLQPAAVLELDRKP